MRIKKQTLGSIILFMLVGGTSQAATSTCFDFSQPIKSPLMAPIPMKLKADARASGTTPSKSVWGAARGIVNKPIQLVYTELLDHYTVKDRNRVKLRVYEQPMAGFQNHDVVMVSLDTPVSKVEWEEEWGYVLKDGTAEAPKDIVISYQKSNGTAFMPHMCGSIEIKSIDANSTDVFLYEEINALGKRSGDETVKGHIGTLATLRKSA